MIVDRLISSDTISLKKIFERNMSIYTFLNPVSYLDALNNKILFTKFDGIFADGGLLVKAVQLCYGKKIQRRSFDMTSLAPLLFDYAQDNGKSIAIVASKQESIEQAVKILIAKYPKLSILYFRNGYFNTNEEKMDTVHKIVLLKPDFLIVGMGIVKQEDFLLKVKDAGYLGVGFTCGGFIHQIAKDKAEYYPEWIDKHGLRFIYRMYKEPHTRYRYFKTAFVFPIIFLKERLSKG